MLHRKINILVILKIRKPKKGRIWMYPNHIIQEFLGPNKVVKWTILATLARTPEHAYEMMGMALNEVTDMEQSMMG